MAEPPLVLTPLETVIVLQLLTEKSPLDRGHAAWTGATCRAVNPRCMASLPESATGRLPTVSQQLWKPMRAEVDWPGCPEGPRSKRWSLRSKPGLPGPDLSP
ncbi:unnamed protein product [Rangifer tarandus platyrhynchus]|uniref:Uncharacterized protein n=1 Tax=Rangifer tarandus platyrhynchus TaxID=3082113 RepID=A0AC59YAQ1_RANTA